MSMMFMKDNLNNRSNIDNLIADFLSYIRFEKKLTKNTYDNYEYDLKNYSKYLKTIKIFDVNLITLDIINYYLQKLSKDGLNPKSITRHITTIKEFHKYLVKINIVKEDVSLNVTSIKQTKKLPVVISHEDMNKILDVNLENPYKYRDKAMLELMYGSGLRVSELVNLTIYSIDLQNDVILIEGKGNKERIVPINKYTKKAILDYLDVRSSLIKVKNGSPDKLFLNNHGKGITRQGFNLILKNILENKDIKIHATPHTLRHTFATDLLNNGADLRSIQELLGHTDIVTTRIYTHVANTKLKDDYIKYNARKEE